MSSRVEPWRDMATGDFDAWQARGNIELMVPSATGEIRSLVVGWRFTMRGPACEDGPGLAEVGRYLPI